MVDINHADEFHQPTWLISIKRKCVLKKRIIYWFIPLCVTACVPKYAEVPTPVNFETTQQSVLQAAKHWEIINKKVSSDLIKAIETKASKQERILLKPENSLYSQQLNIDLINSLTSAGYHVVKHELNPSHYQYRHLIEKNRPQHDVEIELKTSVLRFDRTRQQTAYAGFFSTLSTGLWFLKIWDTTNWARGTAALGAVDAYTYFNKDKNFEDAAPQTEIVVDIIVSRKDEYVATSKGIFYVIQSDASMYQAAKSKEPLMHEFSVIGGRK